MKHRIMITAGGTGGHIFPGIALAQRLREQGWSVNWLGTVGGMEESLVPREGIPFEGLHFKGIRGKGLLHAVRGGLDMMKAVIQAIHRIRHDKPEVVVGFGGYPTMPTLMAARLLKVPVVLHEANRILGMANRVAATWAVRVAISFPNTVVKGSPKYHRQVVHTGAPLRTVFENTEPPRERYQHREGPLRILVVGGSQGAMALNTVVPAALAKIPIERRPIIRHQSGKQNIDALKEAYQQVNVEAECVPFIDDMLQAYRDADVVICRAGALTIAELLAVGMPGCYVPLPTAVDQPANASWCEQHGAGWCMPQAMLTPESLAERIQSWNRNDLLAHAEIAYGLGMRDGTARLADLCEQAAGVKH